MRKLTYNKLRKMWFDFFKSKDHNAITGVSLTPDADSSVLFNTAGMQQLTPYLMGKKHPEGSRLVNIQRCIRTNDIEDVGDNRHGTFFEMMGNWSLGDYFKQESIRFSYEFLTGKDYLAIPKDKIAVTVFEGDINVPKDMETYDIWREIGIPQDKIFFLDKKENWWAAGETGPCGPDTEMFFINEKVECDDPDNCTPACECGRYIEVWNNVFMEYHVDKPGSKPEKLASQNVDTGMGLERTLAVINGYDSIYDSEIFEGILKLMNEKAEYGYGHSKIMQRAYRIIMDHIRATTFIMGDERPTYPSNTGRGYILRRLIRRSVMQARKIGLDSKYLIDISNDYIEFYSEYYPSLLNRSNKVIEELGNEIKKFSQTIKQGMKEFEKLLKKISDNKIPGASAFRLYDTFGFPLELTQEIAKEKGLEVDIKGFDKAFEKHQEKSRAGIEDTFQGGLADKNRQTIKYHTTTHLLLAALNEVFGTGVEQRGSNITSERLRFDFNLDHKMTAEEKQKVEEIVNREIKKEQPVINKQLSLKKAKEQGATGVFESKYDEVVSVYKIGDFSKEICGGPHVENTKELGEFKITKEQSSSAGVRRIKAVLK